MGFEKVLIVDDAHIDRFLAKAVMTRHGFAKELVTVNSAMDALTFLVGCENNPSLLPDIIFLDINMPEMNGFQFLDEFGSLPPEIQEKCSIVMLSSSLNPKDIDQALKSPFVSKFISKPINAEKLDGLQRGA